MIKKNILLGKAKHKLGSNEDNFINIELSSSNRDIMNVDESATIDAFKQYYEEKNSSQKYRLAFTITPYCTNVLFNVITEPVYKEGSEYCKLFTNTNFNIRQIPTGDTAIIKYLNYCGFGTGSSYTNVIKLKDFVENTGYSLAEAGGIKYHCGYDIFNNHHLRRNGFAFVNKHTYSASNSLRKDFNTIRDAFRKNNGSIEEGRLLISDGNSKINSSTKTLYLYKRTTTDSYFNSITKNLSEENGWFGFVNKGTIPVKNYGNNVINKCMNDCEIGDFVDMYPDRTLFSFVPKYNQYRKRTEYNWSYCITYPYTSTTDNYLIYNSQYKIYGIKTKLISRVDSLSNLPNSVVFKSFLKHNLNVGDYVSLTFISENGEIRKTKPQRVVTVGVDEEDKEHYFSIRTSLIANEIFNSSNQFIIPQEVRIRKCENSVECEYYLRQFKKIKDFDSQLNKLAFSQSVYSDQVAQVVFTEDINTEGLVDNLNRPISELYLTIVKKNKGYKEWYYSGNTTGSSVEFSHCFGKVTSGLDLPDEKECKDYNIHRIHNIPKKNTTSDYTYNNITVSPEILEDDITDSTELFYGDIVEFSPSSLAETVLSPVYHRFNTMQRELISDKFKDFYYTEISADNYDSGSTHFSVESAVTAIDNAQLTHGAYERVNLIPEGYYYLPHYGVKIRDFKEEVNVGYHIEIKYDIITTDGRTAELMLDENYYFQGNQDPEKATKLYVYKLVDEKYYELATTGYCSEVMSVDYRHVEVKFGKTVDISKNCKIFKHNTEMPIYAYDLNDGSGKYIWREMIPFEEMPLENELHDSQFTNGAHYHHKNISFYLKRQDPKGEYSIGKEPYAVQSYFLINDESKDISKYEYKNDFDLIKC